MSRGILSASRAMNLNTQSDNMKEKRIGIMGGTFDPIHYGHLVIAEAAWYAFALEKVIFIPTGSPPHKRNNHATAADQRAEMAGLAIASNPHFVLSKIEVERQGFSYSVDTVSAINQQYHGAAAIYFITGADAVLEIDTWHKPEQLLSLCRFVAATRPGFDLSRLDKLPSAWRDKIDLLESPGLDISSTDIRQRVHDGRPIKYLLPESVEEYIYQHQLYGKA